MNLIDNGIETVISIERISTETEMCFLVRYIDWYDKEDSKKVMNIAKIEELTWRE